jgi:bifunctional DNA-binding transcriptional regulator/antitoxin component of YhaV-PrlF toxin-antitoxin module
MPITTKHRRWYDNDTTEPARLGAGGRFVIPARLRRKLGWDTDPPKGVIVWEEDGRLVVASMEEVGEAMTGLLAKPKGRKAPAPRKRAARGAKKRS